MYSVETIAPVQVELSGVVTSVRNNCYGGKFSGPKEFTIFSPVTNQYYNLECRFFCPISERDSIVALCTPDPMRPGKYTVLRQPFVQIPVDRDSLKSYFVKILVRTGFGEAKAERLYRLLEARAQRTQQTVENYVNELALKHRNNQEGASELLNLSEGNLNEKQCGMLLTHWYEKRNLRRLHLLGFNNKEIAATGLDADEMYQRCLQNPYTLPSISLEKCADIMTRLNKEVDPVALYRGRMVRFMYELLRKRKWTAVPFTMFENHFPDIGDHFIPLTDEYYVKFDATHECAYLEYPHRVETELADKIIDLVKSDPINDETTPFDTLLVDSKGESYTRSKALFLDDQDPEQQRAIQGGLDHRVSIITGPPGTGKSSTIKKIVENLEKRNNLYILCSFTGKAVDRLKQVTDLNTPSTIHKILSKGHDLLASRVRRPLYIIVDETSMVTTSLLLKLLKMFADYKIHLVMVGDPEQLEPIDWGSLFEECINSGVVPVYKLTTNHRVYAIPGELDGIVLNTRAMMERKEGESFRFIETANFFMVEGGTQHVYDMIKAFYAQGIKSTQVTVVCPYKKPLAEINATIQTIYNDGNPCVTDKRGVLWMEGDRVIMNVNDYVNNVMNGCEGMVTTVTSKCIEVQFSKCPVKCEFPLEAPDAGDKIDPDEAVDIETDYYGDEPRSVRMLRHSYALTTHKSQGSEWDYGIFLVPFIYRGRDNDSGSFVHRRHINTGLSRFKRAVWVVGNLDALHIGAMTDAPYRSERLAPRIRDGVRKIAEVSQ